MSIKKKGVVFGFLCRGRDASGNSIYRFGKTSRAKLEQHFAEYERTQIAIERLQHPFTGLNKPETVIVWEAVSDVVLAWELVQSYLRDQMITNVLENTETKRPRIKSEPMFGDNFYSAECTIEELEEHLKEVCAIILQTVKE